MNKLPAGFFKLITFYLKIEILIGLILAIAIIGHSIFTAVKSDRPLNPTTETTGLSILK